MKYRHFLIFLAAFWLLSLFAPVLATSLGVIVYIAFALTIALSATKYRSSGWVSDVLLAALLVTFPLWLPSPATLSIFPESGTISKELAWRTTSSR